MADLAAQKDRYEQKMMPIGSDWYYATRFIGQEKRDAIICLYAVIGELLEIVDECQEPQVAQTKITWWREEIHRLYDNEARHPATKLLAPVTQQYDLAKEYIEEIITGVEMDLEYGQFESLPDLSLYLHRTGSMPMLLTSLICEFKDHNTTKFAHKLGESLRYLDVVANLPSLLSAGRFYLPSKDLALANLNYQDFMKPQATDELTKQLRYQFARISKMLQESIELMPQQDRLKQKPLLVLHSLATKKINKIAKNDFDILTQPIEITPIVKAWTAWRQH